MTADKNYQTFRDILCMAKKIHYKEQDEKKLTRPSFEPGTARFHDQPATAAQPAIDSNYSTRPTSPSYVYYSGTFIVPIYLDRTTVSKICVSFSRMRD